MDSNFITAPRRKDLVEEREKEDLRICRQYQKWLIDGISNISIGNKDANLTVLNKIKSCMKDVKLRVRVFEMSTYGTGYRINCDVSERKRFVDMILQIVHISDYIRKFIKYLKLHTMLTIYHMNITPSVRKYSAQWAEKLKFSEIRKNNIIFSSTQ